MEPNVSLAAVLECIEVVTLIPPFFPMYIVFYSWPRGKLFQKSFPHVARGQTNVIPHASI